MYGERATAPVSPPPGPGIGPPGLGVLGPGGDWHGGGQAPASALALGLVRPPSNVDHRASSKTTTSNPSLRNACELRMRGTQARRKSSARGRPPGFPSVLQLGLL